MPLQRLEKRAVLTSLLWKDGVIGRSPEEIRKMIYMLGHAPFVSRATLTSSKPFMALTLQMKVSLKHPGAHDNISVTQAH